MVAATVAFVLGHELGHALIDILDLPVTGRQEDAADQLATLALADGSDEGAVMAVYAAAWFYRLGTAGKLNRLAFADEHSLGQQRFYNIICWVYGQNPDAHQDVIDEGLLPDSRAPSCPGEYHRMAQAWETLLAAHSKVR